MVIFPFFSVPHDPAVRRPLLVTSFKFLRDVSLGVYYFQKIAILSSSREKPLSHNHIEYYSLGEIINQSKNCGTLVNAKNSCDKIKYLF